MNKRDTFNKLFLAGMSYEDYNERSPKHQERMQIHWDVIDSDIKKLSPDLLQRLNKKIKILCIAENWCGDCANDIPIISRMAQEFNQWDFQIVGREAYDEEVIEHYLTAGRKKIPVIVFADEDGDEVTRWVERSALQYRLQVELLAERLKKEDYIKKYQNMKELKPPLVTKEIFQELLGCAERTVSMIQILPKKKY